MPEAIILPPGLSIDERIRELVFHHLRQQSTYFKDLTKAEEYAENIGKITCRDDRTFMRETQYTEKFSEAAVIPYPIYGGAIRFSPDCPEMPDGVLGFHLDPNAEHCDKLIQEIRAGIPVRGNGLLKVGGHGLHCGWAKALKLGVWQQTRLIIDARCVLKARSIREEWVKNGGEYKMFPAYHVTRQLNGERLDRTYRLDHTDALVNKYPMNQVMELMSDERFLELEAPHLLDLVAV